MYKKLLTIFAALTLAVSAAACGKSSAPQASTQPTQAIQTESATPVETTQPATTAPTQTTAPQFQEITLVDDANCTVIIKSIDEENLFGYALNVFLENKTDKELMYTVDNVSVNGFMCDPFWATTVAPGKKANAQITFMDSDFEANGITEVEDITFTLKVYDSNDWMADDLVLETFTVNP